MRISLNSYPAARKTYSVDFPQLTGGLNLRQLDYRMDLNQSPEMKNLWWQEGILQCRDGQAFLSENTELGTGFACFGSLFFGRAFLHIGGSIYSADPVAEPLILTALCSGVPQNRGTFLRYGDHLYYKNDGGFFRIANTGTSDAPVFTAANVATEAFVPVTIINAAPSTGSGSLYQPKNRLSEQRTVKYNAQSGVTVYHLLADTVSAVGAVKVGGVTLTETTDYTVNLAAKTVTFVTAPPVTDPATNNTVEITFSVPDADSYQSIMRCKYAVVAGSDQNLCLLFGGSPAQPNAVFWNSNDSLAMNDSYWPDSFFNLAGDTEDPVSGFGKQYGDLIVFKEHNIGKLTFSVTTVDSRDLISFSYTNVNSKIGCDFPWSIQLVENNLVFCNSYQGVHTIRSSSAAYENNVECVSRNVNGQAENGLLYDVRQAGVVTSFDDGTRYWLCANGRVYLWDYELSTFSEPSWFLFTNIHGIAYFFDDSHGLYHLDASGRITKFVRTFLDYAAAIEKVYQFPAQDLGGYDRLKDVTQCTFSVRSDTDSVVEIQYKSDYETRDDRTELRSMTWRLAPRNLAYRCVGVQRFAHVAHRRPGCFHVRHFSVRLSNNVPAQDLAILSAEVQYKFSGRGR